VGICRDRAVLAANAAAAELRRVLSLTAVESLAADFVECLNRTAEIRRSRGCRLVRFLDRKIAARLPTLYP
jgi:hypothetical protein